LRLAHIDVVEAKREDWSVDPFKLLEKDGYFYGRGSVDDKAMAAIFADMMVRFKKEGFVPNRDLILALTTDEESGASSPANGVRWLIANHKDLIDAEFGLNEGGGGEMRKGKLLVTRVQTSEKVAMNYALTVTNSGGHSSLPRKDNAITRLSAALVKVGGFDFPFSLNETTKLYLERGAQLQTGQLADDMRAAAKGDGAAAGRLSADPFNNSILHTTCVATMLQGGHAANALPQLARAVVNCRILPGESAEDVRQTLVKVVGDDKVVVTAETPFTPSPASALKPEIMEPIETLSKEMFPTALVIPAMSTGATDSRWLRQIGMPMYGVSGLYTDADDVRVHGRDERIGVKDLFAGREFLYRLVKAYSSEGKL
jgi:acetylornithine deacetylase/succinyl-diaminopimelate desuccinylase-like protein